MWWLAITELRANGVTAVHESVGSRCAPETRRLVVPVRRQQVCVRAASALACEVGLVDSVSFLQAFLRLVMRTCRFGCMHVAPWPKSERHGRISTDTFRVFLGKRSIIHIVQDAQAGALSSPCNPTPPAPRLCTQGRIGAAMLTTNYAFET